MKNYTDRDKKHLWHPLTQHGLNPDHLPLVRARGSYLYDDKGKAYIDGISSWYTCMYGHCNPEITSRVKQQLDELDQVVFSGFTHPRQLSFQKSWWRSFPEESIKYFSRTTVRHPWMWRSKWHFNIILTTERNAKK